MWPSLITVMGSVKKVWYKDETLQSKIKYYPYIANPKHYERWVEKRRLTCGHIGRMKRISKRLSYRPKVSLMVFLQAWKKSRLEKALTSVKYQIYQNWELCVVVDGPIEADLQLVIQQITKHDDRIRIHHLSDKASLVEVATTALGLASGEFVGFFRPDDQLSANALFEVGLVLNQKKSTDFIYSDEDSLTASGQRIFPFFKPDWSPDTLRSYNYVGDLAVIRKSVLERAGGLTDADMYTGNYELFLKLEEMALRIVHIPKVLYHRFHQEGSTPDIRNESHPVNSRAKKALASHIRRKGWNAVVNDGLFPGSYRVKFQISSSPHVVIIIPNRDKVEILQSCIKSILLKSSYRSYSVLIVDNRSTMPETHSYYEEVISHSNISLLSYDKRFNYSRMINYAVRKTASEYFILLNNDTEIISPDWIESMLEFAQRKEVGAVGALLYYPDNRVQHGGVLLGVAGVAGHSHRHFPKESVGYHGRLKVIQNLSAVTGACLMTGRSVFHEVGGMDEGLSHAYNDVDFCLRLREHNYLIVYTPYAELYHNEASTRGREDTLKKKIRYIKEKLYFQWKWRRELASGDPYYNLNLSLKKEDFSLRT